MVCASQACTAIKPQAVERDFQVHLEKSPTQEEYVRGHMTQNPYSSASIGPLMRDVKNHICRQLDLTGGRLHAAWIEACHNELLHQKHMSFASLRRQGRCCSH